MRRGRKALMTVALVIFIGALGFVAYELFQVRTVTVAGCETRSQEDVIALSGIEYNTSVFQLDTQKILNNLGTDPTIKPVSVEIKYPDNVLITIEERKAAAVIEKDNAYIVIDREGWVLRLESEPDAAAYPQVLGLPADTVVVGQQIGTSDTFKIGELTRLLDAMTTAGIAPSVIDISLAADIIITLPDGMKVELGDDTAFDDKFALMKSAQAQIAGMGKTGGVLDISSVKNAYYRDK